MIASPSLRAIATSVALATFLGACGSDTTEPEEEPAVSAMIITSGSSTVTVPASGAQTGGALQLRANTANSVSVRFVNAAGADEPVIAAHRSEFIARVVIGTVTTTLSGGSGSTFSGTLTPTVVGAAAYTLELYNTEHGHAELTKTVSVNVVP